MDHAEKIHLHDTSEILDIAVAQLTHDRNGGIVEYKIQSSMRSCNGIDDTLDVSRLCHIQLDRLRPTSMAANVRSDFLRSRQVDVRNDDDCTVGCKLLAESASDARRAARHDNDAAIECS